jgi:pectin methylesterase-like acyl-CoA thioesterase
VKKLLVLSIAAGLIAVLAGCPSTTPSSPNVTKKDDKPTPAKPTSTQGGGSDTTKKAQLKIDDAAKDVPQDKTTPVKITVHKGDYKGAVEVSFKVPADSGITIDTVTIPADKDEAEAMVAVKKDTKEGEVTVPMTAKAKDKPKDLDVVDGMGTLKLKVIK